MADDIAKILREHKAELDAAIDMFNAAEARATKAEAKLKRHQAREAAQGSKLNRVAFDALIKTSRVDPGFIDEVYELSGLVGETRELEVDEMKQRLTEYLEKHPKFLKREPTTPPSKEPPTPTKPAAAAKPAAKPTEADKIDLADGRYRYDPANLSNPDWMLENGDAFAAAMIAGKADRISD